MLVIPISITVGHLQRHTVKINKVLLRHLKNHGKYPGQGGSGLGRPYVQRQTAAPQPGVPDPVGNLCSPHTASRTLPNPAGLVA